MRHHMNIYLGNDYNAVNEASKLTGDVNGDGQVDWLDLSMMADQWLNPAVSGLSADLNDDGDVDNADFAIMAANYKNSGNGIYKGHQTLNAVRYTPGACNWVKLIIGESMSQRGKYLEGDIWSFTVASVPMLPGAEIETDYLRYVILPNGDNDGFINKQTGVNYCVPSKFAILFKGGTDTRRQPCPLCRRQVKSQYSLAHQASVRLSMLYKQLIISHWK